MGIDRHSDPFTGEDLDLYRIKDLFKINDLEEIGARNLGNTGITFYIADNKYYIKK